MGLISGNVFFHADYLLLTQRATEGGREGVEMEATAADAATVTGAGSAGHLDRVRFGNR